MSDHSGDPGKQHQSHRWIKPVTIGATGMGLLLVLATIFIEHSFWLSSVFVNLGTTLFLAAPLAWLGHYLSEQINTSRQATETQISSVRHEVEDVQSDLNEFRVDTKKTISELQDEYSRSIAEQSDRHAQELDMLRNEPTPELLRNILTQYMGGEAFSPGMIFSYHRDRLFCRFKDDFWGSGGMSVQVFERGSEQDGTSFSIAEVNSIADIYKQINQSLISKNLLDPDDFNIGDFFSGIADSLEAVDRCKRMHYPTPVGNPIFVPNGSWIISDQALVPQTESYPPLWFSRDHPQGDGWMLHLQRKSWVDYDDLWEAMTWVSDLGLASSVWIDGKRT